MRRSGICQRRALAAIILILTLAGFRTAYPATQPEKVLQGGIEEVLQVLKDPLYKSPPMHPVQRAKIAKIADRLFDFQEFSRLTLGPFWPRFTSTQRREFVEVFAAFLKDSYIEDAQELYGNERVILLDQRMGGKGRALVHVKVNWRGLYLPVQFRLLQRGATWKVYDILFLGISGVTIYRTQFEAFLDRGSPAGLINRIREMAG
jgi:phospholipid transport system substrate-binding protein